MALAALYRQPGEEALRIRGRGRFMLRVGVALVGVAVGMVVQSYAREYVRHNYDRVPLAEALDDMGRLVLPRGGEMRFSHDNGILELTFDWSRVTEPSNHRKLDRLWWSARRAVNLVRRIDTDRVILEMRRDDQVFARLDWPPVGDKTWREALAFDYQAAGLEPYPTGYDLERLARNAGMGRPAHYLIAEADGDTVVIGRAPPPEALDPVAEIESVQSAWDAANRLIGWIAPVYPEVRDCRVTLAGHEIHFPRERVAAGFVLQQQVPVPDGHILIHFTEDPATARSEFTTRAPVLFVLEDGEFHRARRRAGLWPWQRGQVDGLGLILIDLFEDGQVRFPLTADGEPETGPALLALAPGDGIRLGKFHVRHLGRIHPDPGQ